MKKLVKTMAAVTAAVLTLSFVACSYEGGPGTASSNEVTRGDVSKYADGLEKED